MSLFVYFLLDINNYIKNLTNNKYILREEKDKNDFELILKAYKDKNRKKR